MFHEHVIHYKHKKNFKIKKYYVCLEIIVIEDDEDEKEEKTPIVSAIVKREIKVEPSEDLKEFLFQ